MGNQIKHIIHQVLEDNKDINLASPYQCELLSELCEQALTKAVVSQLADLLGGSVEQDNDGQAIIYTGVKVAEDCLLPH